MIPVDATLVYPPNSRYGWAIYYRPVDDVNKTPKISIIQVIKCSKKKVRPNENHPPTNTRQVHIPAEDWPAIMAAIAKMLKEHKGIIAEAEPMVKEQIEVHQTAEERREIDEAINQFSEFASQPIPKKENDF